jgi:hypothetical protein
MAGCWGGEPLPWCSSAFGRSALAPHTLLAAKVLKDGIDLNSRVLQAFHYEAAVPASLQ